MARLWQGRYRFPAWSTVGTRRGDEVPINGLVVGFGSGTTADARGVGWRAHDVLDVVKVALAVMLPAGSICRMRCATTGRCRHDDAPVSPTR